MNGLFTIIAILSALTIAGSFPLAAQNPFSEWDPITQDDWVVGSDSLFGKQNAIMIFEKIVSDEKDLEDGKCFRTIYCRIRILNSEGSKFADIKTPFFEIDQKLELIKGRTIQRDGTIVDLNPSQIFEKEVIKTKGLKFKQKSFSLPGVTQDCIVEYVLHYRLSEVVFDWIVQKDIPLIRGELSWKFAHFSVPRLFFGDFVDTESYAEMLGQFLSPNYLWLNHTGRTKITQLPDIKKPTELRFEIDSLAEFKVEPFSPPENSLRCRLVCYYGSNVPATSFWGEQSTYVSKMAIRFAKKNKEVKRVVEKFTGLDSPRAKIEAAYRWIQDSISNISYLDEIGEKNSNKKEKIKENESVDDVMKRGYGTRDDIHLLLFDMLREMEIDAKLTFVKSRRDDIFIQKAKYWQFDYSLVAVVEDKGLYSFYAPGFMYNAFGQTPWFCEGINALIGGADDYFVVIPFSPPEDNVTKLVYDLALNDELQASGTTRATYGGQDARFMRLEVVDEPEVDHQKLLLALFEDGQPKAERDSISFENQNNPDIKFGFNCRVSFPTLVATGERAVLNPFEFMSNADNPFHESMRDFPALFEFAYVLNEELILRLPEGWKLEAHPVDDFVKNQAGACEVYFSTSDSTISVNRIFTLYSPFWTVESFPIVKSLYEKRRALSNYSLVLTRN